MFWGMPNEKILNQYPLTALQNGINQGAIGMFKYDKS